MAYVPNSKWGQNGFDVGFDFCFTYSEFNEILLFRFPKLQPFTNFLLVIIKLNKRFLKIIMLL